MADQDVSASQLRRVAGRRPLTLAPDGASCAKTDVLSQGRPPLTWLPATRFNPKSELARVRS